MGSRALGRPGRVAPRKRLTGRGVPPSMGRAGGSPTPARTAPDGTTRSRHASGTGRTGHGLRYPSRGQYRRMAEPAQRVHGRPGLGLYGGEFGGSSKTRRRPSAAHGSGTSPRSSGTWGSRGRSGRTRAGSACSTPRAGRRPPSTACLTDNGFHRGDRRDRRERTRLYKNAVLCVLRDLRGVSCCRVSRRRCA